MRGAILGLSLRRFGKIHTTSLELDALKATILFFFNMPPALCFSQYLLSNTILSEYQQSMETRDRQLALPIRSVPRLAPWETLT